MQMKTAVKIQQLDNLEPELHIVSLKKLRTPNSELTFSEVESSQGERLELN